MNAALSQDQHARLGRYLDLLLAANERMNLTRIHDRADAETFHIGDAMALLPHLPEGGGGGGGGAFDLADVGSGGGVPGVPLAIVRPEVRVTLIESVGKKAAFLQSVVEELQLENVAVVNGRAEALPAKSFDVVTCRAVASMQKLLVWCRSLIRPGGMLLAMKGPKLAEELEEAKKTLANQRATVTTHPYDLGGQTGRTVAKITWPR